MSFPNGMPNTVTPWLLFVIVAVPAVLASKNPSPNGGPKEPKLLFVIVALPAELVPLKLVTPPNLLVMFALAALLES